MFLENQETFGSYGNQDVNEDDICPPQDKICEILEWLNSTYEHKIAGKDGIELQQEKSARTFCSHIKNYLKRCFVCFLNLLQCRRVSFLPG
jgi:hypothetical protein